MVKEITIKLLYSDEAKTGKGTDDDPSRILNRWYLPNGDLILEHDSYVDCGKPEYVEHLVKYLIQESIK